jgi:hypothetical protein
MTKSQVEILKAQKNNIAVQKKQAKIELKKKTDKIQEEIKNKKKEMSLLVKHLKSLQFKAENVEKIVQAKQSDKLESFRWALRPLEDTANAILEERKILEMKKLKFFEKIREEEGVKESKNGEFLILEAQKNEKIREMQIVQDQIEDLRVNEGINFREYCQETETKSIIKKLKQKKTETLESIKNLDKKIEEAQSKLNDFQKDLEIPVKINSFHENILEKELLEIEDYLNTLCKDISITPLNEFVEEYLNKHANPAEDLIKKQQFLIIEQKELEMRDEWNRTNESFIKKIKDLSRTIEEQELEALTLEVNSNPDSELENSLNMNRASLELLKNQAEKLFRLNQAKQAVLETWKKSNRKILLLNENEKLVNDSTLMNLFKLHLQRNIGKEDHWKTLEKIIEKYFNKLSEKTFYFYEKQRESQEIEKKLGKNENQFKELKAFINTWIIEKDSLQKDLLKTAALEKMTIKKFENFKIEIDIDRRKNLEKVIYENLSINKSTMQQIQKTYGQKALSKYKEKEVEEIKKTQEKRKETVKKRLEHLFAQQAEIKNQIIQMENLMNEKCKNVQGQAQKSIFELKQEILKIDQKVEVLNEAENELNEKLANLMEVKKKDIYRSLHKTLQAHGNDGDLKKIKKLLEMKEEKEKRIKDLEMEMEKSEENYQEIVKNLEIEEIRLKIKLSSINDD